MVTANGVVKFSSAIMTPPSSCSSLLWLTKCNLLEVIGGQTIAQYKRRRREEKEGGGVKVSGGCSGW